MPETMPTAQLAEWLADNIFNEFGWERRAVKNSNWECVTARHRNDEDGEKKHTTDAVFTYDHPYHHAKIYLTSDLKSYSKASIQKAKVRDALRGLAESTECANKSEDFQKLYIDSSEAHTVQGLLFVFNNDAKYNKDFYAVVESILDDSFTLKPHLRMYVIGPEEVSYLSTVAVDIREEFAKGRLPSREHRTFFHPNLYRARPKHNYAPAAPVETLLAPWLVLYYSEKRIVSGKEANRSGYYVYSRSNGDSVDEFKFLIDYLFRYHLVHSNETVIIKMTQVGKTALNNFDVAKTQYAADYHDLPEFKQRLDLISFMPMPWKIMDVLPENAGTLD